MNYRQRGPKRSLGIRKGLVCLPTCGRRKSFPPGWRAQPEAEVDGIDLVVVRSSPGSISAGPKGEGDRAIDTMAYTTPRSNGSPGWPSSWPEAEGRVTSVDKANVLETSRLGGGSSHQRRVSKVHLSICTWITAPYSSCNPGQFDVILTGNMFGDILSDERRLGSLGMLPSRAWVRGPLGFTNRSTVRPLISGRELPIPSTILSAPCFSVIPGLERKLPRLNGPWRRSWMEGITPDIAERAVCPSVLEKWGSDCQAIQRTTNPTFP